MRSSLEVLRIHDAPKGPSNTGRPEGDESSQVFRSCGPFHLPSRWPSILIFRQLISGILLAAELPRPSFPCL